VERVRLLRPPTTKGRLYAVVRPAGAGFEARVVDEAGQVCLVVEGYRTAQLPTAVDEKGLESLRAVMARAGESRH
jgi:hypothetical protein